MANSVDGSVDQSTSLLLSLNTLSSRVSRSHELVNSSTLRSQNILCPHCDVVLTAKTYRQHMQLYFNTETGSWMKDSEEADSGTRV